jgi:type IV pilus assembly protein PilQ
MRLKQLLGNVSLLLVLSTTLAASASQLTDVTVASNDDTTTLTIRATGAFTHTQYRPTNNLLLVDLVGVSAAKLESRVEELRAHPGVQSYRVLGYKGTNGAATTRIEVMLSPNAQVGVSDSSNAIHVRITGERLTFAKSEPLPASTTASSAPRVSTLRPARLRNVSVARGSNGLNVELAASATIAPKAMRLTAPERVVIDIPNAVPAARLRSIAVNDSGVKGIRIARFSAEPPATRIVVDLTEATEFELTQAGSRATLKLARPAGESKITSPRATERVEVAAAVSVEPKEMEPLQVAATTPIVTQSNGLIEPTVTTRPATESDIAPVEPTPAERSADAASKFRGETFEVPLTNANASITPQSGMNLATMQQPTTRAGQGSTVSAVQSGCTGNRFTGEPISVNLKDVDVRDFFRLIHEISGLNVVLEPRVAGTLTIVLDDVPWDQALAIVMRNNGLDCQLDGNVLRIATVDTLKKEADARRAQLEAQALAVDAVTITRYLSYAVAKDAVPTIKGFLSARGTVLADERTNALIISDIPNSLPAVDRLIRELDRKTQEVEIEARVVAATRNFARDIGTQLAFGWGNNVTSVGGTGSGTSPIVRPCVPGVIHVGNCSGIPVPQLPIPFFSNLGVGADTTSGLVVTNAGSNYRLDFLLTMAESRGIIKILSRPRIVTQNNVQAVVRQGQRIPVVTAAQLGGPPTVTYVDAFLRLTVRPQITAESTIFLNVDVENTVPDFTQVTTTQLNPILVTQQVTTQVLVTDGGTVVIGGVIQTQNNVGVNQVPLLGSIPVFGNLFKRRSVSTSTQELIFFLTPKIIQT